MKVDSDDLVSESEENQIARWKSGAKLDVRR